MKNMRKRLLVLLSFLTFFLSAHTQDLCSPVGWATQNGGTTGGGNASPVTVTTLANLQTQASSSGAKVIYVSGTMGAGVGTRVNVAANKTIIGLPGAKLIGGFTIKASNVIIRNMKIQGPGAVDVDGVDCITIDGSSATNIWIDHCEIYDGQDGNLDISNGANYIAVTWCKFYYTSASSNHQFCNLIGNSDSKTSDRGKLKVTMMYNWWGAGCKERMPRLRFGQVHMVNNYFNSTGNSHCVRAGKEANLLVESNYFESVKTPIDLYQNNFTAVTSRNNVFVSTTGNTAGSGTSFTPPYSLAIAAASTVKTLVTNAACGAGATMTSPTGCGCGIALSTFTLTTASSPAAGGTVNGAGTYNAGTVVTVTATPAAGYSFVNWSGAASGTNPTTTVTLNSNQAVTANFQAIAPTTYTLSTTASPAAGGTVSGAGTYNAGSVVTVTATPAAGYNFVNWSGAASGTNATTNVTLNSNQAVTANFQAIAATTYTLSTTASPVAGGTVSGAGTYNAGSVVTVTAIPAAGYSFVNWSGAASGTNPTTTVTLNSNQAVTANFQAIAPTTYTLSTTASPVAGGTVSGAGTYNAGSVVTVTATPAAGYSFVNWSGAASGTNATTNVTLNSNQAVTANFQATGGGASTIRIEDNATTTGGLCLYEGSISSNSGANNGKVINLTNSAGKAVSWKVNVPAAGTYTLNWRYVNSSTSNTYSMKFILNGVVINSALPFPKTSGSSVFSNSTTVVTLAAGNNDIRLESIASNATADIDWLEVTGNSPAAANCNAARPGTARNNTASGIQKSGLYPNPAKGEVAIIFYTEQPDNISITIHNANGAVIDQIGTRALGTGHHRIVYNLAGKTAGFYNVVINGNRHAKNVFKLLVQ
jgi:pectate lyase/NOL1/NOP2/fmu family ribosome biogenesis protein